MPNLTSSQRQRLRALAHHLQPVCYVGKQGVTDAFLASVEMALNDHELIKMKFIDGKERKRAMTDEIAEKTQADVVNIMGNIATLFRRNPDPEKRKVEI